MEFKKNLQKSLLFTLLSMFGALSLTASETPEQPRDTGAFIYFKERGGKDESYSIISAPTTLEDKEWKSLFATGKSTQKDKEGLAETLSSFLDIFEQSKEVINTTEDVLLIFVTRCLAPALKPFELQTIPTKNQDGQESHVRITFTSPCDCCKAGRYHLALSSQKNTMHALIKTISDIQASTCIELTSLQPHNEGLRKVLCDIAPNLSKKLAQKVPQRIDLFSGIFNLCHEMVHIARLDALEYLKNKELDPMLCTAKSKNKESQADLIALLILQNKHYFLAAIHFFAKLFLINFSEQADYVLSTDPDNNDLLEELVMFHKKEEQIAHLPRSVRKQIVASKKSSYEKGDNNHPAYFKRMQQILTTWAAYLMHGQEKPLTKSEAIKHITKECLNLFNGYGVTNKSIEKMLCGIVEQWNKTHAE